MEKTISKDHAMNCPLLAFAALVAIIGGTQGRALAQPVGWWGFEGIPGQTAGIGTVFSNRVDASQLPAEVYARYSGADSTAYQPVFEDPIFEPFAMGDSTTSGVSRSTLRFTNPYEDAGRSQGCPVRVPDSNGALDLQTFTLEGWFKMEPSSGNPGWRALFSKGYGTKSGGGFAYTYTLYFDPVQHSLWAYFTVRDGNGNVRHLEQQQFTGGENQPSFNDGNWHYVSLAVNGSAHKAHLFMDFQSNGVPWWRGSVDLGGELAYNSAEPLVLGGNNLANWQFCGSVDEVRLSSAIINTADGALKKRGIPDGTVIGHFPMEGDFTSTIWPNYWTNLVLSAATGGETPTFTDRETEKVLCDKDKVPLGNEIDAKCLTLNKGRVQWTNPELLMACADALTVEFFLNAKADENANWASIVRADYPHDSKTYLPWNISYTSNTAGKDVACRVDTDTSYNGALEYARIPLDGRWHHLALQVWRWTDGNDRKTSFVLYVDYEQRAGGTAGGWTAYPSGTHFGFGLTSTPFVGRIDEMRLTKGLVPVDDFLRLCGWGPTTLIFR